MTAISLEPPSRTVANDLPEDLSAGRAILLLGLPPGGVCRATPLARGAVSSYLTVSPLPSPLEPSGGLISVALSLFLRTVGVTHHPALRSPDFPPVADATGGCPETRRPHTSR